MQAYLVSSCPSSSTGLPHQGQRQWQNWFEPYSAFLVPLSEPPSLCAVHLHHHPSPSRPALIKLLIRKATVHTYFLLASLCNSFRAPSLCVWFLHTSGLELHMQSDILTNSVRLTGVDKCCTLVLHATSHPSLAGITTRYDCIVSNWKIQYLKQQLLFQFFLS